MVSQRTRYLPGSGASVPPRCAGATFGQGNDLPCKAGAVPLAGMARFRSDGDMSGLTRQSKPDRSKINLNEPDEVQFWTRHLNISREDLQKAIDKVGNSAAAVRKELGR